MQKGINVLITGASRGFGLALARQFAPIAKQLLLVVRSEQAEQALQQAFANATIVRADVSQASYIKLLEQALAENSLNVVINNAGSGTVAPTLADTTTEALQKEFNTNVLGAFHTVKGCIAALSRANSPVVFNISSRFGSVTRQANGAHKGSGCSYSYRISKAGQNMLTLALADEFEQIKFVSIHPGRMLTNMASSDAFLTPELSAERLKGLYLAGSYRRGDFISLEGGTLAW